MNIHRSFSLLFSCIAGLSILVSCHGQKEKVTDSIASNPQELQSKASSLIEDGITAAVSGEGLFGDSSIALRQAQLVKMIYEKDTYTPLWCKQEQWLPLGDSLASLIEHAQLYGLFPEDYHAPQLKEIRNRILNDSLAKGDRKDAALWSKADIIMTDALFQMIRDVKLGRLPQDSITLRKDSVLSDDFFQQQFDAIKKSGAITSVFQQLEPKHDGYQALKAGIPKFLASAKNQKFTMVPSRKDSLNFTRLLQKRLYEGGYIASDSIRADSAQLAKAIKAFQKEKGITVDGRAGEGTIRMLNTSDREKFIRIAISMDKYKMLPEKMPEKYIWVNTSADFMQVIDKGVVKLSSKVICGKATTRTPVLTSAINSLITYPQWVPPLSIILKEILPGVKKSPGYLARKGFSLLNSKGEEVDPYSVDWSKYSKGIPYKVVQGSGDANALGVIKFVFDNKYSVYLHDTNQRYLFANAMRNLSHGCVRVQEWGKLAEYILQNDSLNAKNGNYTKMDSLRTWLKNKEKRNIVVHNRVPVFIRYITCEGQNGNIVFYDDVYAEDKMLREKYFASK